ncbi:MAG TPA: hypothetical protein VNE42_10260 [Acidimicrobiales bacterium]|nr:hypothetical protein [Acidimicrobiales bacterium]
MSEPKEPTGGDQLTDILGHLVEIPYPDKIFSPQVIAIKFELVANYLPDRRCAINGCVRPPRHC